jgi:hypothetical protein
MMGKFPPAGATIVITISVSAPLVLIYFALDRIKRLEARLRAIEEILPTSRSGLLSLEVVSISCYRLLSVAAHLHSSPLMT